MRNPESKSSNSSHRSKSAPKRSKTRVRQPQQAPAAVQMTAARANQLAGIAEDIGITMLAMDRLAHLVGVGDRAAEDTVIVSIAALAKLTAWRSEVIGRALGRPCAGVFAGEIDAFARAYGYVREGEAQ